MSDMPPHLIQKCLPSQSPANDNDGAKTHTVSCDLPKRFGIISGEAELIARFLPELLKIVANDNEME